MGCGYAGTNVNVKCFQHSLALISERGRQIYSWSEKSLILPLVENRTCQLLTGEHHCVLGAGMHIRVQLDRFLFCQQVSLTISKICMLYLTVKACIHDISSPDMYVPGLTTIHI